MGEADALTIGTVVGHHGIKGQLKVLSHADSVEFFPPGLELWLSRKDGVCRSFRVSSCVRHKSLFLIALEGIQSIHGAEQWRGSQVRVAKSALPPVRPGTFYFYQIIGSAVYTVAGRYVGRVEEIFPTGSNDVYVVRKGDKEVLIPAIDSVILDVDLEAARIRVDLPEGLEE